MGPSGHYRYQNVETVNRARGPDTPDKNQIAAETLQAGHRCAEALNFSVFPIGKHDALERRFIASNHLIYFGRMTGKSETIFPQ